MRTLVWFRGKDLRLSDHAPLLEASRAGEVVPLFVLDPYFFAPERAQKLPHRMQYLLENLTALAKNLETRGSRLLCVRGESLRVVPDFVRRHRIDQVFAYRWTEPVGRLRDRRIQHALSVPLRLFEGETLLPPETVRTQAGTPFSVYTPFARALRAALPALSVGKAPRSVPAPPSDVRESASAAVTLSELGIAHNPRLVRGGEKAARDRLDQFLERALPSYEQQRDVLAESGTSRLSADLKFGTLSVAEVYERARRLEEGPSQARFLAQLLWREFAYSTLWDHPHVLKSPFRAEFEAFPWGFHEASYAAWVEGQTGYPVVDAAARQLLSEGYVHNRARMIAASFLTKHLLIHYGYGERHYLSLLTDGDWAVNNLGWQWSAGCGVDAQPYFRVFNPTAQGQRFDPRGEYVRRYVPELGALEDRYVHQPWQAPMSALRAAGVTLGKTYPLPIVDHAEARRRFLGLAQKVLKKT